MLSFRGNACSECRGLSSPGLSLTTWLVWTALLAVTGCVEESRYQAVTAEVEQLKTDVERMQAEVKVLDRQMTSLRALNHEEEATLAELQNQLRKEEDTDTRTSQEYEERLATLQAKADTLLSQNRTLLREMREAKKQEASLQALVTGYEKELNSPEPGLENVTNRLVPQSDLSTGPGTATQSSPATPPPPETLASAPTPQPQPPPQTQTPARAQTAPPAPAPQPQPPTGESSESWWSTIKDWLSTIWSWFFS